MRYLLLLYLSCLPLVAGAQIHKVVDEHGNVTYTDNPRAGEDEKSEPVELPRLNTQPPPVFQAGPEDEGEGAAEEAEAKPPSRYNIVIVSPQDQSAVPRGQRDVTISATLAPALFPGHLVEFVLDGETVARGQNTSFTVREIFRGSHQIQVRVVAQSGRLISRSNTVTIHVHRAVVRKPQPKPT